MKKFYIILISSLLLTGCWDAQELEERAFVVAMGVDIADEKNIDLTFQIANPQVGTTDIAKAENEPASLITTLTVPDILASRELANISITRRLTFTHTNVIIISEEFAKSDRLLCMLEFLMRDRELSREVNLIISKESAKDFINNNKPELETRPHKHYELLSRRWQRTGFSPYTTFQRYLQRMVSDRGIFLAGYATVEKEEPKLNGKEDNYLPGQVKKEGGNSLQMIGSAIIKEGTMIGAITGEETRMTLTLRPKIRTHTFLTVYKDPIKPEFDISTRIIKFEKNKFKMDLLKETPKIEVEVPIDIEILGIPSGVNYVTNIQNQDLLKEYLTETLNKKTNEFVKKTQEEFKGDPFQWSDIGVKEFKTIKEFKDFDWMKTYPNMDIEVKFKVSIVDYGRQLQPFSKEKIRD